MSCTKIILHGETLLKSVSAVGFSEKPSFWESVSFHREMFCLTNFLLVLRIYIVNAMIFIKKTLINLFRISFYNLLKIIHVVNLAMLEKLCLVFFFKHAKTKFSCQKSENVRLSVFKIRWNARSRICDH